MNDYDNLMEKEDPRKAVYCIVQEGRCGAREEKRESKKHFHGLRGR